MPYGCKMINGKPRLIRKDTGKIAKTKNGKSRDGGGHESMKECRKQARAIEESENS